MPTIPSRLRRAPKAQTVARGLGRCLVGMAAWLIGCGSERPTTATPVSSAPASSHPVVAESPSAQVEVAVTVDDLPIHGPDFVGVDRGAIVDDMLKAFAKHRLPPVYGFVNGKHVDTHPASLDLLKRWKAAGHPLGNHTYSHIGLNDAPLDAYLADIEKGEAVLKTLVPNPEEWKVFRYPYLFEGPDLEKRESVRAFLAARDYALAPVTIDGDDWAWNPPFARCTEKRDVEALKELRRGYVVTHVNELRFVRKVMHTIAGREVKHVLLLHVGAADADAIDELLTAFEREGVRFIDLPTALTDPIYALDHPPIAAGASLPYRLMRAKGIKVGPLPERPEEDALEATCR